MGGPIATPLGYAVLGAPIFGDPANIAGPLRKFGPSITLRLCLSEPKLPASGFVVLKEEHGLAGGRATRRIAAVVDDLTGVVDDGCHVSMVVRPWEVVKLYLTTSQE